MAGYGLIACICGFDFIYGFFYDVIYSLFIIFIAVLEGLFLSNTLKIAVILGALSAIPPISTDLYIPAFPLIGESFNACTVRACVWY